MEPILKLIENDIANTFPMRGINTRDWFYIGYVTFFNEHMGKEGETLRYNYIFDLQKMKLTFRCVTREHFANYWYDGNVIAQDKRPLYYFTKNDE